MIRTPPPHPARRPSLLRHLTLLTLGASLLTGCEQLEQLGFGSGGEEVRKVDEAGRTVGLYLKRKTLSSSKMLEISRMTHLQELSLYRTNANDNALMYLKDLKELSVLGLGDTQVTDAGLRYLEPLHNLTSLWLSGTAVTDEGLQHLRKLKRLEYLNLHDTQVSEDALERLQQQLPNLKLVHHRQISGT